MCACVRVCASIVCSCFRLVSETDGNCSCWRLSLCWSSDQIKPKLLDWLKLVLNVGWLTFSQVRELTLGECNLVGGDVAWLVSPSRMNSSESKANSIGYAAN